MPATGGSKQDKTEPVGSPRERSGSTQLSHSVLSTRRGTALPLCMTKDQHERAITAAVDLNNNMYSPSSRKRRTITNVISVSNEIPDHVDRAIQMFMTYPVMKVTGTAFENSLKLTRRPSVVPTRLALSPGRAASPFAEEESCPLESSQHSPVLSANGSFSGLESTTIIRGALEESLGSDKNPMSPRFRSVTGGDMVKIANAIKRAAMWKTVIVATLAHKAMVERFRVMRLRTVLKKHLLPTLLKRREETGSIVNAELCKARREAAAGQSKKQSESQDPHGTYLKENNQFFRSLGSAVLLQSFAESMRRLRYTMGEVIVHTEEPSQFCIYFLVGGKCEYRREMVRGDGSTHIMTDVLVAGDWFGGIFSTNAVFDGNYRALSHCIVWSLSSADFERIFIPFADEAMTATYTEALRAHCLGWLRSHFKLPSCLSRVPIYRHIERPLLHYMADFTPVVKIRGEVLFEQGDAPGDVYCLLEGMVKRSVRGCDGTYTAGTSSTLSPNEFSAFAMNGRFLLLGEEPHILPGVQRYRCMVHSRTAFLFRISGERFVSALLDSPTYLVQLREKLTQHYRSQMRLDPACLGFTPLLRELSESSLQTLAQAAEQRVIGRSLPMCDPGQHIKEIFIVTVGSVRDPRTFGRAPTNRLPTPPPTVDFEEEDGDGGESGVASGSGAGAARKLGEKKATAVPNTNRNGRGGGRNGGGKFGGPNLPVRSPTKHRRRPVAPPTLHEDEPSKWTWSISDVPGGAAVGFASHSSLGRVPTTKSTGAGSGSGAPASYAHVSPDEQSDLNPALPAQPSKRFLFTLGGGWEGLLTDKWHYGWETTTTVEAWAIPTLKVRTEFNNCPRSTQLAILNTARQLQKLELDLPNILVAKLPPMSVYLPPDNRQQVSTVFGDGGGKTAAANSPHAKQRKSRVPSGKGMCAFDMEQSVSQQHLGRRFISGGDEISDDQGDVFSSMFKPHGSLSSRSRPAAHVKPSRPPQQPTQHERQQEQQKQRRLHEARKKKAAKAAAEAEEAARMAAAAPKASMPHFRFRKPAARAEGGGASAQAEGATTAVSSRLLAMFNGDFKEADMAFTNIAREPCPLLETGSKPSKKQQADSVRSQAACAIAAGSASVWPTAGPPSSRWFHDVPSHEPLPGTTQNKNARIALPTFAPNTSLLMTRSGNAYAQTLDRQAKFFSQTASPPKGLATSLENLGKVDIPKRHALV